MGGFPIVALGSFDERSAYQIVEGIYSSVITGDITKRHNITNFDLFNRVVKYVDRECRQDILCECDCEIFEKRGTFHLRGGRV